MKPRSFSPRSSARDGDRDVRLDRADRLDALRRREQRDEAQIPRADLAQPGQRGARRAAGRQHRVDDEHDGVRDALGQRLVVAVRAQRLLVAAHAEVADGGVGHQPQEPLDHAEAGPEHGDDHDRPVDDLARRRLQRREDLDVALREAARGLVGEHRRRLRHRRPELRTWRVDGAQDRHRLGEHGVVDDMDSLHVRGTLQSAPMDARRNVELKARDPDPDATLRAAIAHGATDEGTLHQRDVYFGARDGRLKLRMRGRRRASSSATSAPTPPPRACPPTTSPTSPTPRRRSPRSARRSGSRSRSSSGVACCSGATCASTSTTSTGSATGSSSRPSRRRTPT